MKLAIKSLCVMAPMIVIWAYTWTHPLAFMDEEAPYYLWNKERTNTPQDKYYDTVILGDSVANAAYVPEVLSDSLINLSLGGTTPVENYYILKEWLKENQAPDTCFISFLDMHFQAEDSFWTRTIYTHRFPATENLEIIRTAVRYGEDSIAVPDCYMDVLAYELYLPNKYITALMNAGFNQRYAENVEAQRLNEIHGGRYIARGTYEYSGYDEIVYNGFSVNEMFDDYYRRLLRLCMENNIRVHIVKPPLPENVVFTDTYRTEFYDYYNQIREEFPEVTVDWIPVYARREFSDSTHMNSHGALHFSRTLKELYPNDFKNMHISVEQQLGINDSILNENLPEQLLEWIAGKDYTLVIDDGTGVFADVCGEEIERNAYQIYQAARGQNEGYAGVYFISGINHYDDQLCVQDSGDGLILIINGSETWLWGTPADDTVNIAVVDQYEQVVLCKKLFCYIEDHFKENILIP